MAVGFGRFDEDQPAIAQALLAQGPPRRPGPVRAIPGAQQVLATAYAGRRLVVLAGSSPGGQSCCSAVHVGAPSAPGFGAGRVLISGLGGATQGLLVPAGPRLLAVVATERGVWASLSTPGGKRFGSARRLTATRELPQAVAAIPRADGGVIVAWAARTTSVTGPGPSELSLAQAGPGGLPSGGQVLVRVPASRAIDEIGLAAGPAPSVAWVESTVDARGGFRSLVRVVALGGPARPSTLSDPGQLASGLAVAGSVGGVQVLSWKACQADGACAVRAVLGQPAAPGASSAIRYSRAFGLGQIDPSETPAAVVTSGKKPIVAWIDPDGVQSATAGATGFAAPHRLFRSPYAASVAAVAGPAGGAVVAWVNGTARERVLAAVHSGG